MGSLVVGSVRSDISLSSLSSPTGRARDVCRQGQTEWSGAAWVSAPRGKRIRPAAPAPARFATPGGRLEAGATRPRAAARPRWPSSHRDDRPGVTVETWWPDMLDYLQLGALNATNRGISDEPD